MWPSDPRNDCLFATSSPNPQRQSRRPLETPDITTRLLKEKAAAPLMAARLTSLLSYDPLSGNGTGWSIAPGRRKPGAPRLAASTPKVIAIFIDEHPHYAHSLAHLYIEGIGHPTSPGGVVSCPCSSRSRSWLACSVQLFLGTCCSSLPSSLSSSSSSSPRLSPAWSPSGCRLRKEHPLMLTASSSSSALASAWVPLGRPDDRSVADCAALLRRRP